MHRLIIFFFLILIIFQSFAQDQFSGKVVGVSDGNTLQIIDNYQDTISVVVKSIDCPELNQEMGKAARSYTTKYCLGSTVGVELFGKDRFGNDIANITINKTDLSKSLLEAGLAWYYCKNKGEATLEAIEKSARAKKAGLWANENPVEPWIFRRQQSMLAPKLSY